MNKSPRTKPDRVRTPMTHTRNNSGVPSEVNTPAMSRTEDGLMSRYEREKADLAAQIGMDYETEKHKYGWFLDQLMEIELPPEWLREEQPDGKYIYINEIDGSTLTHHPLLSKFRTIFVDVLNTEEVGSNNVDNFLKQYKTRIGSVPAAQKKEPKATKKGNAKGQAIVLGSTLSQQILKGNVATDKSLKQGTTESMALLEEGKSKDRYDKIKEMLTIAKKDRLAQEKEVDNLDLGEAVLQDFLHYYRELYGEKIVSPPPAIESTMAYLEADPSEMLNAAKLFEIRDHEHYLFWTLRVYVAMPLPEFWKKTFDQTTLNVVFADLQTNTRLTVHPCFLWIKEIIQFLRSKFKDNKEEYLAVSSKIRLQDQLKRAYEVDFGLMLKEDSKGGKARPWAAYFAVPSENGGTHAEIARRKKELNPNFRDAHIIELANQAGVDINEEVHLLMVIEEFVRAREKDEKWTFRYIGDGECFWINHEQKKAVKDYPHIRELKKAILDFKEKYKNNVLAKQKKEHSLIKMIFTKLTEEMAMKILMQEAKNFVEYFFQNREAIENTQNSLIENKKVYSLQKLTKLIGSEINNKQDLFEILFYCPFNLEFGVGELSFGKGQNLLNKIKFTRKDKRKYPNRDDKDSDTSSDLTTDSAKDRRLNINDPQKLISLADGYKDKNIVVASDIKKKAFLNLLFDWDKKYGEDIGDHEEEDSDEDDGGEVVEGLEKKVKTGRTKNKLNTKKLGAVGKLLPKNQKEHRGSVETLLSHPTTTTSQANPKQPTNYGGREHRNTILNPMTDNKGNILNLNKTTSRSRNTLTKPESIAEATNPKGQSKEIRSNHAVSKQDLDKDSNTKQDRSRQQQQQANTSGGGLNLNSIKSYRPRRAQNNQDDQARGIEKDDANPSDGNRARVGNDEPYDDNDSSSSSIKPTNRKSEKRKQTMKGKTFMARDIKENPQSVQKPKIFAQEANDIIREDDIVLESREVSEYEEVMQPNGKYELVKKKVRRKVPVLKKKERKKKKVQVKRKIKMVQKDRFGRETVVEKEVEEEVEVTDDEEGGANEKKKKTKKIYKEVEVYVEVEEIDRAGVPTKRMKKITRRIVQEVPWDYVDEDVAKEIRDKITRQLGRKQSSIDATERSSPSTIKPMAQSKIPSNANVDQAFVLNKPAPSKYGTPKGNSLTYLSPRGSQHAVENNAVVREDEDHDMENSEEKDDLDNLVQNTVIQKTESGVRMINLNELHQKIMREELQDDEEEGERVEDLDFQRSNSLRKKRTLNLRPQANIPRSIGIFRSTAVAERPEDLKTEDYLQTKSLSPSTRRSRSQKAERKFTNASTIRMGLATDEFAPMNAEMNKFKARIAPKRKHRSPGQYPDATASDPETKPSASKPGFFFTEWQPSGQKQNKEFVQHMKSRIFIKQLDEIIVDFLSKQYAQLSEPNTIDLDDPNFRRRFMKNNKTLIRMLRKKLLKNQDFFNNIYTNTFVKELEEQQPAIERLQMPVQKPSKPQIDSSSSDEDVGIFGGKSPLLIAKPIHSPPKRDTSFSVKRTKTETTTVFSKRKGSIPTQSTQHFFKTQEFSTNVLEKTEKSIESVSSEQQHQQQQHQQQQNSLTIAAKKSLLPKLTLNKTEPDKPQSPTQQLNIQFDAPTPILDLQKSPLNRLKPLTAQSQAMSPEAFSDRKIRPLDYPDTLDFGSKKRNKHPMLSPSAFSQKLVKPQTSVNITNIGLPAAFADLAEKEKKYYLHYQVILGDPKKLIYHEVANKIPPPKTIHTYSLMLMASRLGIKVTNESSDLAWIPYLVLAVKLPSDFEKKMEAVSTQDKVVKEKLCHLKEGSHPADRYFKIVIENYIPRRQKVVSSLTEANLRKYVWSHSWLKFRHESGNQYYFNMQTKEKADLMPADAKSLQQKLAAVQKKLIEVGSIKDENERIDELDHEIGEIIRREKESLGKIPSLENLGLMSLTRSAFRVKTQKSLK